MRGQLSAPSAGPEESEMPEATTAGGYSRRTALYARILVPLDGSVLATGLLPVVKQLVTGLNSPVHFISVVDSVIEPATAGHLADWNLRRALAEEIPVREDHVRGVVA